MNVLKVRVLKTVGVCIAIIAGVSTPGRAQDDGDEGPHGAVTPVQGWVWTGHGSIFFGRNYQQRRFLDFSAWESQNWFMGSGERALGQGRLTVEAMLSLEPFTIDPQGSPQLFQTGETYRRIPLVNWQHPHDLLMGLGATYHWPNGRDGYGYFVGIDVVGSPTLGPDAFMHRESARTNPQVPLTHHLMDSTHITPGVIRGGVRVKALTFESSVFRGAEPDEDRTDIDRPALDSWAGRVRFTHRAWSAQFSGGHLHQPEWYEPYNVTRLTASVSYAGELWARPFALTAAWGANREFNGFNGNHEGYLVEWDARPWKASTVYGRAELVDKELFNEGAHPKGIATHPHFFYSIKALTLGYLYDVVARPWGRVGIGADLTLYHMPPVIQQFWGGSRSYHVFLRWRTETHAGHVHKH